MKWLNLSDNVNLLSIIGAAVIVLAVLITMAIIRRAATTADAREKGELSEHEWDEIGEYKNPLPIGWAVMFVVLICFGLWYMVAGYPLGKYSSIGEYNQELAELNAKYAHKYAAMNADEKRQMGEGLYLNYCAACHGLGADGMDGKAQDLTRWGGEDGVLHTLEHGSTGLGFGDMPAGLVADEDARDLAHFIAHGLPEADKHGAELFADNCSSCHGEDGAGMEGVAPSLVAYSGLDFVKMVLKSGKDAPADAEGVEVIGKMPSFASMLSEQQMDALARYVHSLKDNGKVAPLKE